MGERAELDDSQRRVAEADPGDRLIVTAGAGQGKTEVVAARLAHLMDVEGLSDADEILILSFSRAAVAAVRQRLRSDPTAMRVSVRTFDSFASRLLMDAGEDSTGWNYDRRIREARRLLRNKDSDVPTVELLRHVIVDEVQDLVGDRAELVLELLCRLAKDGGFTVLGDPLQGIYDFQLDDSKSSMTSGQLLDKLRGDLGARDEGLEGHYRAQSDQAQAVVSLGARMRGTPSGKRRLNKIRYALETLPRIGTLDDLPRMLQRWQGRTAVLCDTNGQAMLASRTLFELGITHRLRRPAEQVSLPSWIAAVLGTSPTRSVTRPGFDDLVATSGMTVPDDAWRLLKAAERRKQIPRELDIVELGRSIAGGAVPVELVDSGDAPVIVSTIHRAKGLEFQNVVLLVDPECADKDPRDGELDARARSLYVALSRARRIVTVSESPSPGGLRPDGHGHQRRWIQGHGWRTTAFEVQLRDIERHRPYGPDPEAAGKVQELLRSSHSDVGLGVVGCLDAAGDPRTPVYDLSIDGHTVATTSAGFGEALIGRLNRAWRNNPGPPAALRDLYTDGVETAAGSALVSDRLGVGRWGLWLTLRVAGLARLEYEKREEP